MRALDLWLLNKLDSFTTKLQRKGYRLTDIYVQVAGFVFVTNTFQAWRQSYIMLAISGTVWGCWLWGSIRWADQNKDYPQSAKIMEKLNAKVLYERENANWIRYAFIGVSIGFLAIDALSLIAGGTAKLPKIILEALSWYSVMLVLYLAGCFYIGPGHFAKEQQEQTSRDAVLDT